MLNNTELIEYLVKSFKLFWYKD